MQGRGFPAPCYPLYKTIKDQGVAVGAGEAVGTTQLCKCAPISLIPVSQISSVRVVPELPLAEGSALFTQGLQGRPSPVQDWGGFCRR